jgi:hypothetical protein
VFPVVSSKQNNIIVTMMLPHKHNTPDSKWFAVFVLVMITIIFGSMFVIVTL